QTNAGLEGEVSEPLIVGTFEPSLGELNVKTADPVDQPILGKDGDDFAKAVEMASDQEIGEKLHRRRIARLKGPGGETETLPTARPQPRRRSRARRHPRPYRRRNEDSSARFPVAWQGRHWLRRTLHRPR